MNRHNCQVLLWKCWASERLIEINDMIRKKKCDRKKDNQLLFGQSETAAGRYPAGSWIFW